jgi:hypothetical protein
MIEIEDDGQASGAAWMKSSPAMQAVFEFARLVHAEMPVELEEVPVLVEDFGGLFAAVLAPVQDRTEAVGGSYQEGDLFAVMATEIFKENTPRVPAHPLAPSIRVNANGRLAKKKAKAMAGMNQISIF